jgi:hypothetical protein
MTAPSLNTLLPILLLVSPAFTQPSFHRFLTLFSGWVRTSGVHAVTESLVVAGVSGTLHHAAFHRFFSRARWSLDEVGRLLLLRLVALSPGPLRLVLDDTLCTHKGPKVFGLGVHVDAVRSTRKRRLLTFGHVWVVLAVLVPVPFSGRVWALPVLFRLFRTQADCQKTGGKHLKKTQLARQLVEQVKRWLPDKPVELVADSAYSCREVLRHLPPGVVFTGSMCANATLQRPRTRKYRSPTTGRLLTRDIRLPNPEKIARDKKVPWLCMTLTFYGELKQVQYKELVARWYRSAGKPLLKSSSSRCLVANCPCASSSVRTALARLVKSLKAIAGAGPLRCSSATSSNCWAFPPRVRALAWQCCARLLGWGCATPSWCSGT